VECAVCSGGGGQKERMRMPGFEPGISQPQCEVLTTILHTPGEAGYRSQYLSHAKRALYHLSYIPIPHHATRNAQNTRLPRKPTNTISHTHTISQPSAKSRPRTPIHSRTLDQRCARLVAHHPHGLSLYDTGPPASTDAPPAHQACSERERRVETDHLLR
jgi:hypothetical protein